MTSLPSGDVGRRGGGKEWARAADRKRGDTARDFATRSGGGKKMQFHIAGGDKEGERGEAI